MRNGLEILETTDERFERLREQRREIKQMRTLAKKCCMWVSGAAFIMTLFACGADMETEAIVTGVVGAAASAYGLL